MNQPAPQEQPDVAFRMSRRFDARRADVWRAFTQPARLEQWFGPAGFSLSVAAFDMRPGGVFHYCMRGGDGLEMWGKWIFREIEAEERIAAIIAFSDAAGGIARHPMNPLWPRETLATSRFTDDDGGTRISLVWEPINETQEERAAFAASHDEMRMGWGGTYDKLADYLARG